MQVIRRSLVLHQRFLIFWYRVGRLRSLRFLRVFNFLRNLCPFWNRDICRSCNSIFDSGDQSFSWAMKRLFLRAIVLSKRRARIKPEALKRILSVQSTRIVTKNLEFSYNCDLYQIQRPGGGYHLRNAAVTSREYTDGTVGVFYKSESLQDKVKATTHETAPDYRYERNQSLHQATRCSCCGSTGG